MTSRPEPKPDGLVTIWCDDSAHSPYELVTSFYPAHGGWQEWLGVARLGNTEQTALVLDEPFDRDRHRGEEIRYRLQLRCKRFGRCRQSVEARQEKLFAVLDAFTAAGLNSVTLSTLAASLGRITS